MKDHRTKHEVGNIQAVMDGEIDPFIEEYLKMQWMDGTGGREGGEAMAVNVLIVDDLAFIKIVLRDILEKSGFRVVGEASNGERGHHRVPGQAARRRADGHHDARHGRPHGAEEDPRDRSRRRGSSSAPRSGQQRLIVQAIQLGAKDFIVKPFQPQRVVSALKKALDIT